MAFYFKIVKKPNKPSPYSYPKRKKKKKKEKENAAPAHIKK